MSTAVDWECDLCRCAFSFSFLTGNPCTEYDGYRSYVVAALPQLEWLDGKEIEISERILANQELDRNRARIVKLEEDYAKKRVGGWAAEKARASGKKPGFDGRWYTDTDAHLPSETESEKGRADDDNERWDEPTAYTPESRLETHRYLAEKRKENEEPRLSRLCMVYRRFVDKASATSKSRAPPKRVLRLQTEDGRRLNVNEGKFEFSLTEIDGGNAFALDVAVPRFLDTSLMDCDIEPTFVKCVIKGKVLQLTLPDEVSPDRSSAKRSQTTGHLVLTMPKVNRIVKPSVPKAPVRAKRDEVPPTPPSLPSKVAPGPPNDNEKDSSLSSPFIDDPDVPPLI
ncbi:dynein axonemal assembly factor 11-like [Oscarella lobularis]|uniref:dynein axonemal assembly factor 11-like n=1 Tax=Oscarella lobularis TaxID=121494 RepID=UPI0033137213